MKKAMFAMLTVLGVSLATSALAPVANATNTFVRFQFGWRANDEDNGRSLDVEGRLWCDPTAYSSLSLSC